MNKELDLLFSSAIDHKATDIHLNFKSESTTLHFRTIYGLMPFDLELPYLKLYQYLKYLAKLDLAATSKPQSGVFSYIVKDKEYFCRFSAMETFSQKSGVLRILNLSMIDNLKQIATISSQYKKIKKILDMENGLILFSGTTGSGKSTTMFTALSEINFKSIYTLEDPIERLNDHFMQIQINEKTNLDFQEGIRQLLRHDPDIIVIGEIRSESEASAAIRCCYSGHLVMATIHSASAALTLSRLLEFNISKNDLTMLSLGIIHQKLITKADNRVAKLDIMDQNDVQNYITKHLTTTETS